MSIKFHVPGVCVAQPRHSVGAGFQGGRPRAYIPDDHPVHTYKKTVAMKARTAMGRREPLGVPLSAALLFVMPKPKRERDGYIWKAVKPDVDNLCKSVFDACKGLVFVDDALIVAVRSLKLTAPKAVPLGLYVMFTEAGDVDGAAAAFFGAWNST